ncbi:MAG: hypothetical protein QXJ11_03475 [Candidatus Bathyarchaeia archaeon]
MKRLIRLLLLLLCLVGMVFSNFQFKCAEAVTISVTRTFTSQAYDGYGYNRIRTAPNFTEYWTATANLLIGQRFIPTLEVYYYYRSYLYFETSIIPDNANVTSAILSLYVYYDHSDVDFNVTVQSGMPTYPHIPLQSGDYYYAYYSGNGGSRSTAEITGSGYWNITLNSDGLSWINVDGYTKLCLRSGRDIDGVLPTGNEYVNVYAAEQGEDYAPKLYVSYETEGYRYILHGPYRESGAVANQAVNATVEVAHEGYYEYTFNGSDGTADTYTVEFENQVLSITWNASSFYLNTSRTITPRADYTFEEFWLYVPDITNEWADIFAFNILDLAGIKWGYLEVSQAIAGQTRVIERVNVQSAYQISFYLIIGRTYTLRVITDLGTATLGAYTIKPTDREYNIVLTPAMFPPAPTTLIPTCNASRVNATFITATYCNPNQTATWVYYEIKHRSGQTWQTDYTFNSTLSGAVDTLNWNNADNATSYIMQVVDSEANTWTLTLPAPPKTTNPWQSLDSLWPDSPIPFSQIVAVFIVLMVLGVFSYATAEIGMFAAWITAIILWYIGWLQLTYTLALFALAIVVFATIAKAKRDED